MPLYQYAAMDATGKERKGQKEAANEEAVTAFLKEQGMFPTSIKQVRKVEVKKAVKQPKKPGEKKKSAMNINISLGPAVIKTKQLTIFTRQLSILLNAGLPLIRSLRTLEKQSKDPVIKKILGEVANGVEAGSTFSESLAQHPKSSDPRPSGVLHGKSRANRRKGQIGNGLPDYRSLYRRRHYRGSDDLHRAEI